VGGFVCEIPAEVFLDLFLFSVERRRSHRFTSIISSQDDLYI